MKRILLFIMAITFSLAPFAQKHTAQKKPVRKTAVTAKKKAATPARKTNSRGHVVRKTSKSAAPTRAERKAATYSNASIRGLQGQRASIQKKIREQEQALRRNQADVKKRLEDLMALNGEIDQSQKKIDGIQKDIHHIDGNIGILQAQLKTLQQQLQDRKNKYIRSMRYMSRHHTVQDKLTFNWRLAKNRTCCKASVFCIRYFRNYLYLHSGKRKFSGTFYSRGCHNRLIKSIYLQKCTVPDMLRTVHSFSSILRFLNFSN